MAILKTFYNWTDAVFSYTYGGEPYSFNPGQSMLMEEGKANFFAKHLADWQMGVNNVNPQHEFRIDEFKAKCFVEPVQEVLETKVADAIINQEVPAVVEAEAEVDAPIKRKPGRPAKAKIEAETEFEGV